MKTTLRRRLLSALMALLFLPGLLTLSPITALAADSYTADVLLTFTDSGVTSSDESAGGYVIDGTTLTINAAGAYAVTGACSEGHIVVKKGTTGVVLILKDLSLACSTTAPIACNKSTEVVLFATGDNTVTDLESDETLDDYEGAAIKAKAGASLTIEGDGALTVVNSYKNGVKGGAEATITVNMNSSGSALNITAANNGLACDGSLIINSGSISITAGNEGVKSEPDEDDTASLGEITVNGGSISIDTQSTAGGDGIQAANAITITGGSFAITSYNDAIQSGGTLTVTNGSFDLTAFGGYTKASVLGDNSAKGLKVSSDDEDASLLLSVTGGSFSLNTADDAVHSDGDISITGGTFAIRSGDDAIHADSTLILGAVGSAERDPLITVSASYEGYEASFVVINGGKHYVVASDDGLNAAGGNDGSGWGGPGTPGRPGGPGGSSSGNYAITVNDGLVYVNAEGDGLDSNGAICLYGGELEIWGQKAGYDNEPLDCDGTLTIKGATVFAAGGIGMGMASPSSGSQSYYNYRASVSSGKLLTVKSGSTTLYQAVTPKNIAYVFRSWPGVSSYTVSSGSGSASCAYGNAWCHSWDAGSVSGTTVTYTCTVCGETETQTLAADTAPEVSKSVTVETETAEQPAAPVLSLAGMDTDGVHLTWTAVDGADSYELSCGGALDAATTSETSLTVPAAMNSSYTFSVRAQVNGAWSDASNSVTVTYQPFTDVSGAKTTEYVAWAFNNGVVKGTSSTTFSPDESCSRVQFVMMLWKLNGSPEVEGTLPFTDVSGAKTTKAVLWALNAGVIVPAEEFHPDDNISRAQIVMILWKLAGSPEVEGSLPFTDVSGAKTAKAVLWAYQNGITKGTSATTFSPNDDCTRVQLVVFLYKYSKLGANANTVFDSGDGLIDISPEEAEAEGLIVIVG